MGERQLRKILEVGIYEDTRTVDLMDRFEGFGHDVAYQQLVLRNIACVNINGNYEYISLVVERSKDYRYIGNITFTELKQGQVRDLYSFLKNQISVDKITNYKDKDEICMFDTPYLFRAQNSSNRSGYGWGYGGTQYGETTAYVFVGAFIGYKSRGFADSINASLESADLSEFSIKNHSDNSATIIQNYQPQEILLQDNEPDADSVDFEDTLEITDDNENQDDEEFGIEFVAEKRNIPDEESKPSWFYAGFSLEINMFILALEQKIYLPPVIDECEKCMQTDENTQDDPEMVLTDMEKTFMFVEMLANAIGYSGASVLALDQIHKRKVLQNMLLQNIESYEFGEYGENAISFHLIGDFLDNQPELAYRGFVEIILSRYQGVDGTFKYELLGGFRDFGDNEIASKDRHYWIGKDRYLLDEDGEGSYLQGIYEMAMNS